MGYGVDSLIGVAIALPLLGIIAVILRFYVRLYLKRDYLGVDDWLILASIILVCGQAAIQILGKTVLFHSFEARFMCLLPVSEIV